MVKVMKEASHGKILIDSLVKSIGGKYSIYLMQILSMIILARIFTPEQFGIFAIIQVFAIFFALFSEIGLVPALVNEKNISEQMRNGVFGFTLVIGFVVFLVFIISSPFIAWFYNYNEYQYLVIPVAISIIFNAISIVPIAAYSRDKKFYHIARAEVLAELTSLIIIVVLISVSEIESILVLVCKPLIVSIVRSFSLWFGCENTIVGRPVFSKYFNEAKPLFKFSIYQFMSNVMFFFSRNLDNLLVGKYFGSSNLGFYDKAYQLMRYPLMLLSFAMAPAIQPVLKELNNDRSKFTELHNKFISYLSIMAGLVGLILYFTADVIVWLLLGSQWGEVANLLHILAISVPIQIVLSSTGGFFQAANRPDLLFTASCFSFFTNVTAIMLTMLFGDLFILCWAISASFTISFFQCYYLLGKHVLNGFSISLIFPLSFVFLISLLLVMFNILRLS